MLVRIQENQIDLNEILKFISDGDPGAEVLFSGVVRKVSEYGEVEALVYEAYEEMAKSTIVRISQEATEKHNLRCVAVIHRIGRLFPGEISVAVGVSSMHRKDAFAGCSEIIDRIKSEVPIWKKDVFPEKEKWRD